jgi:hypothetical protein
MTPTSKTCFFVAPIGEEGSETRRRSDQVLKDVVEPPAKECGYTVTRADPIAKPGVITSQVTDLVLGSDLVIANLTGRNPNVFYELVLRHAIRKPYILVVEQGEPLSFDVAGVRTIALDHKDLDSIERCKGEIARQIHELEKVPADIESPVSAAIEIQKMRTRGQPVETHLAGKRDALAELARRLDSLEERLADAWLGPPSPAPRSAWAWWGRAGFPFAPPLTSEQVEKFKDYMARSGGAAAEGAWAPVSEEGAKPGEHAPQAARPSRGEKKGFTFTRRAASKPRAESPGGSEEGKSGGTK